MIAALRRRRYQRHLEDDYRMLAAISESKQAAFSYELGKSLSLRSWRTYSSLDRLMQAGLVEDGWEDKPVHPRRWYRLTAEGRREMTVRVLP